MNNYSLIIIISETSWQAPSEGFMSVEELRDQSFEKAKKDLAESEKERRKEGWLRYFYNSLFNIQGKIYNLK